MEDEQKIKTSIYLPPSVHRRVKQKALDLGLRDTNAMLVAIEEWLEGQPRREAALNSDRSDSLTAGLSPENRARVVALIEMLSGESTGVEHLDLMKAPVIGYLDTWASQTRKPSSGRKQSGKHA